MKCPNPQRHCPNVTAFKILHTNDGSGNVDNAAHNHMRCEVCGYEFNEWLNIDDAKLRKMYGESWYLYK